MTLQIPGRHLNLREQKVGVGGRANPGETYWKVANGIRMTGMPAFQQSLSTDQMWQVSLLLANSDKLPKTVADALNATAAGASAMPEMKK